MVQSKPAELICDRVNLLILAILGLYFLIWSLSGAQTTFSKLRLDRVDTLPVYSADSLNEVSEFDSGCRWSNCWDVFNCSTLEGSIYAPPLEHYSLKSSGQITPKISREFYSFYKWLSESRYFTSNPNGACIKIPPFDFLSTGRIRGSEKALGATLRQLPHWDEGKNWIILTLNALSNQKFPVPTGKALLASTGLTDNNIRFDFDVPVSFYSHFLNPLTKISSEELAAKYRPHDLIIPGDYKNEIDLSLRTLQSSSEFNILRLSPCLKTEDKNELCDDYGTPHKTPQIFSSGKFCLVSVGKNGVFQSNYFAAALGSGCIPVIVAKNIILPFEPRIDWPSLSIKIFPEDVVTSLVPVLKQFNLEDRVEARDRAIFLFQKFFSSSGAVGEGILAFLSDRLFPHNSNDYEYWNGPTQGVQSPLFMNKIAPDDGFTSVILAYDRIESLFRVIESVALAPSLKKILVVWNNQKKAPPPIEQWPSISVPLRIIRTANNVLSNRFYPYDEIETSAVLSIDDDIVMLTSDEIQFGYQTWREFPDRLVGYPPRLHLLQEDKSFRYESEWTNEVSIILTGASFYHKYFSHVYSHLTPAHIRDWVDTHMNCEDILMNFVIANATGKAPIKVSPRKKFRCQDCSSASPSLSVDPSHMVERSECINFFTEQYGHMPLRAVQFRADPVLFKDSPKKSNKDNVQKKYDDALWKL